MSIRGQKIFTKVLNSEVLTFTAEMGITSVSVVLIAGAGSFTGSLNVGYLESEPIPLVVNSPIGLSSDSGLPLEDVVIDCSGGGTIYLIGRE